ncbi:hypothetical protein G9A89_020868 [Geosiphon pyriformis]|nr:hypothetical protein G9A89_020868 [Geosiphon pyriformis]
MSSSVQLPHDCLVEIFDNFKHNRSQLHSCLRVNRQWCRIVVEYLWCRPFQFFDNVVNNQNLSIAKHVEKVNKGRSIRILETYFSCLSEQEILHYQLPIESSEKRPVFDYWSYLKNLDLAETQKAVENWILFRKAKDARLISLRCNQEMISVQIQPAKQPASKNEKLNFRKRISRIFSRSNKLKRKERKIDSAGSASNSNLVKDKYAHIPAALYQIFLSRCPEVKYLSINCGYHFDPKRRNTFSTELIPDNKGFFDIIPMDVFNLASYPNAQTTISTLVEFVCSSTHRKTKLFLKLSSTCQNLQRLAVYIKQELTGITLVQDFLEIKQEFQSLTKLIRSQKNLRDFELWCQEDSLLSLKAINGFLGPSGIQFHHWLQWEQSKSMIQALCTQINSLESVTFHGLNMKHWHDVADLSGLKNVRQLKFDQLASVGQNLSRLSLANLPNLYSLAFTDLDISQKEIKQIVKGHSQSLTSLDLRMSQRAYGSNLLNSTNPSPVLRDLPTICPNLTHFRCYFVWLQQLDPMYNWLHSCLSLQSITVDTPQQPGQVLNINHFLRRLGSSPLPSLRHFEVNFCCKFSWQALSRFLTGSEAPLATVIFRVVEDIEDEHLDTIVKSLKGTLKTLILNDNDIKRF